MDDLRFFDPGEAYDAIPGTVSRLKSNNSMLTFFFIATLVIAGYYAYQYYESRDDS